jgi:uncharacterized membrane protein YagU involved in acid resistance
VRPAVSGALAGLVGGLVFGAAMAAYGALPTVASILRVDSPVVGFAVHLVIAAAVGAGFGLLVARQRTRLGETLFWGLTYGAFWWFLGPQTLLPLLLGEPVAWDLRGARALFPSLIGHLCYGATTAVAFVALTRHDPNPRPRPRDVVRGLAAGLLATAVLVVVLGAPTSLFVVGALVGLAHPLLFGPEPERGGPAVVRGVLHGFLWWLLAALTAPPLLTGGELDWSLTAARVAVPTLPALLLLGGGAALAFTWIGAFGRWLFSDDVRRLRPESSGSRGLHALGHGAVAGLLGGLVFTVVMVAVDALPTVAGLVGGRAVVLGLVVHLVIAQFVGVSYAVLFRRRSFDLASGLGWGVSYGFVWWVLGGLTLLPLLTTGTPAWSVAGIAAAFPSLVGHLAYGAALGGVHQRLEARVDPWWLTRSRVEADRVAMLREQTAGSAPALWALTVVVALTVPLLITG